MCPRDDDIGIMLQVWRWSSGRHTNSPSVAERTAEPCAIAIFATDDEDTQTDGYDIGLGMLNDFGDYARLLSHPLLSGDCPATADKWESTN